MLWRPTRTFLDLRTTRCRSNQRALARRVDSWSMDALFLFGNTSRFRADDRKWDALGDKRYFDWIRARQSHWTIAFLRNARVTLVCTLIRDLPEIDYASFRSGNSPQEAFTIVDRLERRIDYEFRDAYVYFISMREKGFFFFSLEERTSLH